MVFDNAHEIFQPLLVDDICLIMTQLNSCLLTLLKNQIRKCWFCHHKKGLSIYYVSKIVGGWVLSNAYNCLYTWWVGLNKFICKIFICKKNEKPAKFPTKIPKLCHKMSWLLIMTIFHAFPIPILCLNWPGKNIVKILKRVGMTKILRNIWGG